MLLHLPVNHHLRPLYRALAGLAGLYVLVFGIAGFSQSRGLSLFAQHDLPWVLGLRTNPAFALLSIASGAVILVATVVGRNLDHLVYLAAGIIFMLAGIAMMLLLQTPANFLGFSMSNCIVSFILGLVTFTAGLYGRSGTAEDAQSLNVHRHTSR